MLKNRYSNIQLDCLKELVNIGGGNAATNISKILRRPVDMEVPLIEILDYKAIYKNIMAEDQVVTAITIKILGNGEGMFLYVINDYFIDKVSNMILEDKFLVHEEIKLSSVKELVNIIVNSFLNAVSKLVDIKVTSSIPILTRDLFGAILSSIYMEAGQYDNKIMIIKNKFFHLEDELEASLYFVPQPGVLENLFKKIGV